VNFHGQRAGLQHEREVLRLADREVTGDLRAVVPADAVRVLLPVDRGPRLDLAVEHDREVLQHRRAEDLRLELPLLGLGAGHVLELVRPLPVNCIVTIGGCRAR
jgi:hypothetical protein